MELAGLQAGEHFESQTAYRDHEGKRKLPDFVIKLPDSKSLIIDSKVSLVDYDRAIAADTDEGQTEALNAHAQAVRNHIDDLASKDYSNLPGIGSPDFVLMFMPIEPAYIEAMKHNKSLFNYGYNKVRFITPVKVGANVRASAVISKIDELSPLDAQPHSRCHMELRPQG